MNWGRTACLIGLAALMGVTVPGCSTSGEVAPPAREQVTRSEGWTDETHGDSAAPDYDAVFPQDRVNRLEITVTPEDWEAMQANLTELLGPRGVEQRDRQPRAPGVPGWIAVTENPVWVPATVECDGLTWTNVGIRYKGNSSLRSGWSSGSIKLPLKLDFDEFEDEYPETSDQRFYGFKQLALSNAFSDGTYMRDAIASDILREAGLPAAETALYEVMLDHGEGPVNLGRYVAIEVVDDTVVDRFFGDDSGNIYEADGPGASLAEGTSDRLRASFLKENNQQEADWTDIEELYAILHSDERLLDPVAWRASLESAFNVDGFLEWLAVGAVIQHWDTYGQMSHNFYLYHDPDTDLLNWISWDHNQVLAGGGMAGRAGVRGPGGGTGRAVSLGREEVGANWPLIRYLLDDPVYHDRYVGFVGETVDGAFDPEALEEQCRDLAKLIAPYATEASGEVDFESAVQRLIDRIYERHQAAADFVAAAGGA
ncbi:MAG: CotH kinase family protein [Dehalococcoidia bacterium]|nr:CotH kinase family protein [Dehalococcoidia bacterium]